MSRAISRENIIEACLDGVEKSSDIYRKWSGGEWLWNAPEYLITIKIAEKIANIKGKKLITLEDNIDYILDVADAKGADSLSKDIRGDGRSDIIVWWADRTPRAIIEVKNSVYGLDKIVEDIRRVQSILNQKKKDSRMQFGIVTFYIDRKFISRLSELSMALKNTAENKKASAEGRILK